MGLNLNETERGNTWLTDDSGEYILISLDQGYLEISILPENYPGLSVRTVDETEGEMVAFIRERYEGWFIRKWNLSSDEPCNEEGYITAKGE